MQILLINLAEAQDRLAFQQVQFEQLGLSFKRIEAVNGREIDEAFYRSVSTKGLRLMTKNEVACFLSHQNCWQHCVDTNMPVIILEDDIVLSAEFANTVNRSIDTLARTISLINLEMFSSSKRVYEQPLKAIDGTYHLHETQFAAAGAGAYMINPETAAFFIKRSKEMFNLVDLFMYSEKSVRLLQIAPAPAMQMNFLHSDYKETITQSYINQGGQKRPSSWESFIANPMTRIRRLKANFKALHLKYFSKDLAHSIPIEASADIQERFNTITAQLKVEQKS